GADRHRGVHHRRDVAHRAAGRPPQRSRLRRRGARHRRRLERLHRAHPAPRRGVRAPPARAARPHRHGPGGQPGPAVAQRPRGIVAGRWLTSVYEPITAMVPRELRGRLEPAEVFHEILEHRWYLSERAGREVDIFDAARSYIDSVLADRPVEDALETDV